MRTIFFVIVFFHGLIHLLGFAKAYNLKEIKELTLPISRFYGNLWFTASILFILSGLLFVFENEFWWLPAIVGIILSQFLIIIFWKDAKFGTLPNLIILVAVVIGYANFSFQNMVSSEVNKLIPNVKVNKIEILDSSKISNLPIAVQNWLDSSGAVGKPIIKTVWLKQKAKMKMNSDQKDWYDAEAEQYFATESSSFIWKVKMKMMSFLQILGRDKLINGKGEMLIKMFGLFSLVDTKNNPKLNSGSLQRYLAEIVWFPSAAINKNISWESINDTTAKATIHENGTIGSGTFYFNKKGMFKKFSTLRYFGGEENSKMKEWVITPSEYKTFYGITIPSKSTATWKLENGNWDWLKVEITEISYNFKN